MKDYLDLLAAWGEEPLDEEEVLKILAKIKQEEREGIMKRLRAAIKYGDLREGNIENCLEQIENYNLK